MAGDDASVPNSDKLGDVCDSDMDNDWMLNTDTDPTLGTPGENVGCGSGVDGPEADGYGRRTQPWTARSASSISSQ